MVTGRWLRIVLVWGLFVAALVGNTSIREQTVSATPPVGGWRLTGDLHQGRDSHTATLLQNGKVLVAGGLIDHAPAAFRTTASAELYDPATGQWTTTGSMQVARTNHIAVLLANGQVLVAGGITDTGGGTVVLSSAEIYDPGTGVWSPTTGPLTSQRGYLSAVRLPNGKVLIAGGYTANNGASPLNTAELFDPATGTFTATGTMHDTRQSAPLVLLPSGRALIMGGQTDQFLSIGTCEIFDPATNTWTVTGSFPLDADGGNGSREGHSATLLADGRVLVVGGTRTGYFDPISGRTFARFDFLNAIIYSGGVWTNTGAMSSYRSEHTATLLSGGGVLVAGNNAYATDPAEQYDPLSGSWSSAAQVRAVRDVATATLLPNGAVLLVGGCCISTAHGPGFALSLTSTEVYSQAPIAQLGASSFSFGEQPIGTPATQFITLRNFGAVPLSLTTVTLSGATNAFSISGDQCSGQTVSGGGACGVTIRFQPPAMQNYVATLSFADNASGSPQQVALAGNGTASGGAALSLSPSTVNFGNTPIGATYNAYKAVIVTNAGSQSLAISALTITGGNTDDFGIADYRCQGATIAPNDYCTIYLSFHPGATNGRSSTLNIYSNANADTTVPTTVPLSGSGITSPAALVNTRPNVTDFGSQNVGVTSAPQTLAIRNSGNAPLHVTGITFAGNSPNSADFTLDSSACTGATVPAAGQCAIPVRFRPGAAGVRKAILIVNDDAADSPQVAFLQGVGVVPNTPAVTVSPQSIAFGNQTTNTTSGVVPVTLQNTGAATLSISSIAVPDSTEFTQTNTCGTSVVAGASCTINVTFTPATATFRQGTLTITDNAGGSPQQAPLNGTGVSAGTPTPIWNSNYDRGYDLGSAPVGGGPVVGVRIQNLGTGPMQIISCTTAGDLVYLNGCEGATVDPNGGFLDLQMEAFARQLGARSGTLTIATNDSGSPHVATYTMTGTGAPVVSLPVTLAAGNQSVTTTSGPKAVTLLNRGNVPLSITNITTSGEFGVASNTCGSSLGAYFTCTINVTFTPAQLGQRTGTLTVTDNAAGSPHTVGLTGTGTTPPPRIAHLSTLSVPVSGGAQVTITGSGFQAGATVFFGDTTGTVVGTPTNTSVVVATPPHAAGTVDVTVANPDGQYSDVATGFSFVPPGGVGPPPVQPTAPPAGGGTPVPLPVGARPTGSPITGATPIPLPTGR